LLAVGKAYKQAMQFAVQDRIRRVTEINSRQAANLARFLAVLLSRRVRVCTVQVQFIRHRDSGIYRSRPSVNAVQVLPQCQAVP
jgi:hypothetical protein